MLALILPEPALVADTSNFLLREPAPEPLSDVLPDIAPLADALADQADVLEYPYRVYWADLPLVRVLGPCTVTLQPPVSGFGVGSGSWPRVNVGHIPNTTIAAAITIITA